MIRALTFTSHDRILWENIAKDNSIKSPFASFDWHETWMQTIGRDYTPLYLIIDDKIISPFVLHENIIEFAGFHVTDYCDLIGPDNAKEAAWSAILTYLSQQHHKDYHLRNIPADSSTLSFFKSFPHLSISFLESAPFIELPATFDEYHVSLSRDHRRKLLRNIKNFESLYPDAIISQRIDQNAVSDFIDLMKKNPAKDKFLTIPREQFFRSIALNQALGAQLSFLSIKSSPIAANLSFIHEDNLYSYNSGYDSINYPGAGFYLRIMLIKKAIENGIKKFHLLRGNEPYKYRLGAKDLFLYELSGTITST